MKMLREVMREGFIFSVQRGGTVAEAARTMEAHNVGIVAILEGERLVGVFSERDIVRRVNNRGLDPAETSVGDVMTFDLIIADPDEDYQTAMRKMDQANIRHLPIVCDGNLISMLSIRDLMRVEMERMTEEIRYLHEYLYQVPR